VIKEYFSNYFLHMSDVTFDMSANTVEVHNRKAEPWRVTLVDTGEQTMTGGRIKRISKYIENEDVFCMTYGDGVGDVDITKLLAFHKSNDTLASLTAVFPPGRFGALDIADGRVLSVKEKPQGDGASVNGGYFVLSPKVLDLIEDDQTVWERGPLEVLVERGQLASYVHTGFWQPMDTLREKNYLEELWQSGKAPWKVWT
jgi:glucose-1-phosphate cytidylyltransferase